MDRNIEQCRDEQTRFLARIALDVWDSVKAQGATDLEALAMVYRAGGDHRDEARASRAGIGVLTPVENRVGLKWRPSNGMEGGVFIESWCCNCEKDANNDCPILGATFSFDVYDERYPPEWQYGHDGKPKCSAFEAKSTP